MIEKNSLLTHQTLPGELMDSIHAFHELDQLPKEISVAFSYTGVKRRWTKISSECR